jgi:hypothetical protein
MSTPGLPGDKLFAPINAPKGTSTPVGVQPGTSGNIILAQYVVIFGSTGGMFVYAGGPAPGNPPIYSVSNADTDPYGNTVNPGIWAGPPGSIQVGLQAEPGTNFGQLLFLLPGGPYLADPAMFGVAAGGGALLAVTGAADTVNPDSVTMQWFDNISGGGSALWRTFYKDIGGSIHLVSDQNYGGLTLHAASVTGIDPSTGTSLSNPFAGETWHTITTDAGWGSLGEPAQYRLLADSGLVALRGDISHAATAVQTDINSGAPLPAAYRPAQTRYYRPPMAADLAGAIEVQTTGVITMRASGFGATQAILDGIYSL